MSWVQLPEPQLPAASEVETRREGVRGLRSTCGAVSGMRGCVICVHACLQPRRVCLYRRLIQFLDWGVEAARDMQQPDFSPSIIAALSSPGLWGSGVPASQIYVTEIADAIHTGRSVALGVGGSGAYSYPG